MSAATGIGLLDLAVLDACDRLGAMPDRPHVKSARILDQVHAATGIGPRVAYEPLCDLARPWRSHLLLLDFHGNVGSPDFGPASPRYTEVRLAPLGVAALAAERGDTGPLPIGLINGDLHVGGHRPPLDPARVVAAVRAVANDPTVEVASLVGPASFPSRCLVDVADPSEFASGGRTSITVTARVDIEAPGRIVVSALPPDSSAGRVLEEIEGRMRRHRHGSPRRGPDEDAIRHLVDATDLTSEHGTRIELRLAPDADHDAVIALLHRLWAIRHTIEVGLDEPLHRRVLAASENTRGDLEHRLALVVSSAARTAGEF